MTETLTFAENAAIWTLTGLLAFSGTPLAAIAFLTVAPKFVIDMRTGNLGGIVTMYVDGIPAAVVDTHADAVGVLRTMLVGNPDNDTHQIYIQKDDNPDTVIEVVRKELTETEVTPANIRYDADCDCVQQSSDGGTTWNDAPGLDPRHAPSFRAPANSTGAPQCNAAANMVAYLQALVALDIASSEMVGIVAGFVAVLLPEIPVIGWIIDAVILAAEAIIAIGASAISSAFTSTVYDDLLCTFVANTDETGQMSDAQNTAFINDVFTNYASVVYDVILAHNTTLGAVGWSNAGANGEITDADCTACCHDLAGCFVWDWQANADELGWTLETGFWDTGFTGTWGYRQQCLGGGGSTSEVNVEQNFGSTGVLIDHIEMDGNVIGTTATNWTIYAQLSAGSGYTEIASGTQAVGDNVTFGSDVTNQLYYGLQLDCTTPAGCGNSSVKLFAVRIHSDDLCPLGLTPNC